MNFIDLIAPLLIIILIVIVIGIAAFLVKLSDSIDKQEKTIRSIFRIIEENHAEATSAIDAFESTRERVVNINARLDSVEFELKGMREKMKEIPTKRL